MKSDFKILTSEEVKQFLRRQPRDNRETMISNCTSFLCNTPTTEETNEPYILTETLIDHFFKIFDKKLIYKDENFEFIFGKAKEFLTRNNMDLKISIDDSLKNVEGIVIKNTILITSPSNPSNKEFIYTVLHELSHCITNKSSNNKLKLFLSSPLDCQININNITHLKKELDYMLSPIEMSNWAFTFSLIFYEHQISSVNDFYESIKLYFNDPKNQSNDFLNTSYLKKLPVELYPLYPLYYIFLYIHQLKVLGVTNPERRKYNNRLVKLIKLLDKYVKRLNLLFN